VVDGVAPLASLVVVVVFPSMKGRKVDSFLVSTALSGMQRTTPDATPTGEPVVKNDEDEHGSGGEAEGAFPTVGEEWMLDCTSSAVPALSWWVCHTRPLCALPATVLVVVRHPSVVVGIRMEPVRGIGEPTTTPPSPRVVPSDGLGKAMPPGVGFSFTLPVMMTPLARRIGGEGRMPCSSCDPCTIIPTLATCTRSKARSFSASVRPLLVGRLLPFAVLR